MDAIADPCDNRVMTTRSQRFLMAMWEGGGNIPPEIGVARRLVHRGHTVHVLADPTIRTAAEEAGCTFSPWRRAPHRTSLEPAGDIMRDWETKNPLVLMKRLRDRFIAGPAGAFAADTAEAIEEFGPDCIVPDAFLFGAIIAAQAARLPVALLLPNIWMLPSKGTPPIGLGFPPARTFLGRTRDATVVALVNREFRAGLPALNKARGTFGLGPLSSFYDQALGADRILVLSSETFDYASATVPANVRYVGPVLDDPEWVERWQPPWPGGNADPIVLVAFSSTYQNQGPILQRVIEALSDLPVRGVVTLGQMLDSKEVTSASNVSVVRSAPHSTILPSASVVVTHCGHGSTMRALTAGLPMICIPMGRDQNDTAARVVHHRAGVRLSARASVFKIRSAIEAMLSSNECQANAEALGKVIAAEHQPTDVVGELESVCGAA
jgi:MGT family glycosyltransferase